MLFAVQMELVDSEDLIIEGIIKKNKNLIIKCANQFGLTLDEIITILRDLIVDGAIDGNVSASKLFNLISSGNGKGKSHKSKFKSNSLPEEEAGTKFSSPISRTKRRPTKAEWKLILRFIGQQILDNEKKRRYEEVHFLEQ